MIRQMLDFRRRGLLALTAALAGFLFVASSGSAFAYDKRYPDWPCQQLKVPEITVAAIWPGFMPEKVANTSEQYPGLSDLVDRLAARRTSMDEAGKLIDEFVSGSPEEKKSKAQAIFAKLFDKLNAQRSQVMNGIERAYRKQKDFAEQIRSETAEMRDLQDKQGDEKKIEDIGQKLEWQTRIFSDRRQTMSFACEVPVLIDQRLFGLARLLQQAAGIS